MYNLPRVLCTHAFTGFRWPDIRVYYCCGGAWGPTVFVGGQHLLEIYALSEGSGISSSSRCTKKVFNIKRRYRSIRIFYYNIFWKKKTRFLYNTTCSAFIILFSQIRAHIYIYHIRTRVCASGLIFILNLGSY